MSAVYVCPIRDIECGNRVASWCDECPKRATAAASPAQPAQQGEREAQPAAWRVVARKPGVIFKWKAFVDEGNARSAAKQWPEQFPYLADCSFDVEPLYLAARSAPRPVLTDEAIIRLAQESDMPAIASVDNVGTVVDFARQIERAVRDGGGHAN